MGAALAQLVGYIVGDVARPSFVGVECDYPNRIVALTLKQMANERVVIGILFMGWQSPRANLSPGSGGNTSPRCVTERLRQFASFLDG